MGSSASKASRAAGSTARKYPTRASNAAAPSAQQASPANSNAAPAPPPAPHHQPGPTVRPQPQASSVRSEEINLDASDPHFAKSLRSIGPVQPNPTLSQTSTFRPGQPVRPQAPDPRSNPAIVALDARSKLQDQAEREFMEAGRRGHEGREFLDVWTIRQILMLRDEHRKGSSEIERKLGLKQGVVERLGTSGVVELAQEVGRAEKEIRMV